MSAAGTRSACVGIERLCIRAVGPDAAKYLHSQLSNDIASMRVGDSKHSFVLEPTGKIVALLRVTRLADEEFLLDTDPLDGLAEIVLARLNKFKIRVAVEFDVSKRRCAAVRSLEGDPIARTVREVLAADTSLVVVDAQWSDATAVDVLPTRSDTPSDVVMIVAESSDAMLETDEFLESERVRKGWPAMGSEIVPCETLVAATGLTSLAVSFDKGCYPGQELVERMDSRGSSAPRVLRKFARSDVLGDRPSTSIPGQTLCPGQILIVDGREIGTVTSVAGDWALAQVARGVEFGEPVSPEG